MTKTIIHPEFGKGRWIYRAIDSDGCYLAEAYDRESLLDKLIEEFGSAREYYSEITGEKVRIHIRKIWDKTIE